MFWHRKGNEPSTQAANEAALRLRCARLERSLTLAKLALNQAEEARRAALTAIENALAR